jgi:hypothetical protein
MGIRYQLSGALDDDVEPDQHERREEATPCGKTRPSRESWRT